MLFKHSLLEGDKGHDLVVVLSIGAQAEFFGLHLRIDALVALSVSDSEPSGKGGDDSADSAAVSDDLVADVAKFVYGNVV